MRIFITGATGFLGYHVALKCLNLGYELLCLRRDTSIIPLLFQSWNNKIHWVIKGADGWKQIVQDFHPDILIHCAWKGTTAHERNNEYVQCSNIQMLVDLIMAFPYKQVICLGSQDEYGNLNSIVDESVSLLPQTEYAKAKISCCQQLSFFSRERSFEWQWIRVFSIYGEKQDDAWFIPSMIKKCLRNEKGIPLTKCEQQYAYLYSEDFASAIVSMLGAQGKSGIYNLSASRPVSLKEVLFLIQGLTESLATFNFGFYHYRLHQSMMICGDSSKFISAFGAFEHTPLEEGLRRTIDSIKIDESF